MIRINSHKHTHNVASILPLSHPRIPKNSKIKLQLEFKCATCVCVIECVCVDRIILGFIFFLFFVCKERGEWHSWFSIRTEERWRKKRELEHVLRIIWLPPEQIPSTARMSVYSFGHRIHWILVLARQTVWILYEFIIDNYLFLRGNLSFSLPHRCWRWWARKRRTLTYDTCTHQICSNTVTVIPSSSSSSSLLFHLIVHLFIHSFVQCAPIALTHFCYFQWKS